ncbi:unnamed protein product, partial [Discosporangium mesarthrocarpum]
GESSPLVRCLQQHPTLVSLQRIGAWSLCNLFDGQPRPTVDVPMVMPAINRLLKSQDAEVLSHACFALSHLCDGSAAHIKVVVESGVCRRLVELLDHGSWRVVKPALRTIGNVVCAEDDADYTEAILEAGSVPCLRKLIAHPNREIQKEACWTLSNIAAGSVSQIQSVLDSGAMPQLIELATAKGTDSEVRSEAFWVVLNAASCGSDAQIEKLVKQGCVPILSDLLSESSMVMMALEGIERVLSVGDQQARAATAAAHAHHHQGPEEEDGGAHCNECAEAAKTLDLIKGGRQRDREGGGGDVVSTVGGHSNPYASMLTPERIQELEGHKNSTISKRAVRLWSRYFVTCAICHRSYSLHGGWTAFCRECKCHVCRSCNCTVFHLDYQEMLWQEMEGKEKKGKEAQVAARKSKKAKKREKKKNAKDSVGDPKDQKQDLGGGVVGGRGGGTGKSATGGGDTVRRGRGKGDERFEVVDPPRALELNLFQALGLRRGLEDPPASGVWLNSGASTESNSEDDDAAPQSIRPSSNMGTPATGGAAAHTSDGVGTSLGAPTVGSRAGCPSPTPPQKKPTPMPTNRGVAPTEGDAAQSPPWEGAPGEGERRAGKKQGRRGGGSGVEEGLGSSSGTTVMEGVVRPLPSKGEGRENDNDSGEPWVVVGAKTQQGVGGGSSGVAGSSSGSVVATPWTSGAGKAVRRKKGQTKMDVGTWSGSPGPGPG